MRLKSLRRDVGASWSRVVLTILAVVLLIGGAGPVAAQSRALDCNSNLMINFGNPVTPGATFPVTLDVVNGPSTDAANAPVEQRFQKIVFYPSCTTTLPCAPDAALPVSFVGLVSNTCGTMITATAVPAGPVTSATQIEFTFSPDPPALELPPAATAMGTTSCQIVFNAMLGAAATMGPYNMEATTSGVCQPALLALSSSAEATAGVNVGPFCGDGNLDPGEECDDGNNVDGDGCNADCTLPMVPTLGQYGLLALALLLALGFWAALRRRTAG